MFENMPEVPKGKLKIQKSSSKRFPWMLGLAGCLILLVLAVVAVAAGWYLLTGPGAALAQKAIGPATPPTSTAVAVAAVTPRGIIAYSEDGGAQPENKRVWVMKADGSAAKKILDRASSPALSPDGTLIAYYHWDDGIYVANADGTKARKVLTERNAKYITWSHDGGWITFSSQPIEKEGVNVNIDAVRPDGSGRRTFVVGGSMPSWSPDDKQLVFHTCRGGNCGIYKASVFGGDAVMVVGEMGGTPSWSPDGRRIVYHADTDTVKQIFVINADGTGKKQITSGTSMHVDPVWSADGALIYYRSPEGGPWGIWRMNPDGSNPVRVAETGAPVDWAYERLSAAP